MPIFRSALLTHFFRKDEEPKLSLFRSFSSSFSANWFVMMMLHVSNNPQFIKIKYINTHIRFCAQLVYHFQKNNTYAFKLVQCCRVHRMQFYVIVVRGFYFLFFFALNTQKTFLRTTTHFKVRLFREKRIVCFLLEKA